jgi:hypothetical protein
MSTGATYQDVSELFATWSKNFIALRYPYEKYEGFTEEQYRARGEAWLAAGADPAAADFTYHPEELNGWFGHWASTSKPLWRADRAALRRNMRLKLAVPSLQGRIAFVITQSVRRSLAAVR